jgi:superfamily I DNA/RNA helicase
MLNSSLNPEANNLISILRMLHCTSLELDPIIFNTQLSVLKPNIEHIVIDESQDSNRLEFLTMLKMAVMNDISIYIVGDCAQTLYEFRDADPRILNNLTKLFATYDLSINHRSTQIILDVANLMSSTMSTHKTTLRSNQIMQITQQAIDDTITMNTYDKVTDPATLSMLDEYLTAHLGKNESVAVIARSGEDVKKLHEHIQTKFGTTWNVQNITSQRRNDITILSMIGQNLRTFLPKPPTRIQNWAEFENYIKNENIRINSHAKGGNRYNQNGPTLNKVTIEWLMKEQSNAVDILNKLNDPNTWDAEIRKLQLSLLDTQTEKNNLLQRVMDAKNAKLKEQKADIIICTVHGVKGLEYDNVACFINTEAGRNNYHASSDENKRISYVALTRAKLTECVFCSREKLLKDFEEYRKQWP